jgi:hypothetical protein
VLTGSFRVVPGSAGAGNIVYRLMLRNRSAPSCVVSGRPRVQLLDARGRALPTHVIAARPQRTVRVTLARGVAAQASARFSPDVPGPGETTPGRCEPVAHRLRVFAPGGGSTVVAVSPPTSVCEHGTLQLTVFARA